MTTEDNGGNISKSNQLVQVKKYEIGNKALLTIGRADRVRTKGKIELRDRFNDTVLDTIDKLFSAIQKKMLTTVV